ncbi:MAG: hypothetical protein IKG18_16235 [Atopobiaceae bacterium]|nr:hypothetical protein [Atopobiaceae bacterium]
MSCETPGHDSAGCHDTGEGMGGLVPEATRVLDARMNENVTLDLWCEGGARHVYSCDADVLACGRHAADLLWSAGEGLSYPCSEWLERMRAASVAMWSHACSLAYRSTSAIMDTYGELGIWPG